MARQGAPAPVAGEFPIDTGTCELEPDPYSTNGWVLRVNGVPSSHIDLDDPLRLDFEYMRWIAALVDARWGSSDRLRVLHLGGGACSLPRYIAAAHPAARQVVVELDGKLAELVRQWFDLPRAPLVRIRVGEAREVTRSLSEASRDLIIRDVFAGSRTPHPLTTVGFTQEAKKVLAADGIYLVNCGDSPDLKMARREAATIASVFTTTAIVADPAMLKGRRYGNVIIAGSDGPLGEGPGLARGLLGGGVPAHLWHDDQVRRFAAGAQPLTD
jgi:spermidine synthase